MSLNTSFINVNYKDINANFEVRADNLEFEKMFIGEIWEDAYYFKNDFEVKKGMRVLDIGGHIGIFSILAEKLGATVVAFEPVIENLQMFLDNVALNSSTRILPVFGAIGGTNRFDEVNIPDPSFEKNTGKSFIGANIPFYYSQQIAVYSINDVFKTFGSFDYIKLDCEGAEYEIIYSMTKENMEGVNYITMEFHGKVEKAKELEVYLKLQGFDTWLDWAWGEQGRLQARRK